MARAPAPKSAASAKAKTASRTPDVSIVVPVYNEEGAAPDLAREIAAAFKGRAFEIVFVDDASTDATRAVLTALMTDIPQLRVLGHRKNAGQSRAVRTGVLEARGAIVVTLDGDGQNDPADIPGLLETYRAGAATGDLRMVAGQRVKRQDVWIKRVSSKIANGVRSRLLRDSTPDTGCGLKVFDREAFLRLPWFDHMHRFLPALMLREGYAVVSAPVGHRPRSAGVSKYGTWDRLWVGIVDILGVAWLQSRAKRPEIIE